MGRRTLGYITVAENKTKIEKRRQNKNRMDKQG